MVEKYLSCISDNAVNPFMHIKQKVNGELCFRFLNVTNDQFDFHYTRHNNELHTRIYYKGMNPQKSKTDIKKTDPVYSIKNLQRIRALIVSESTCFRISKEKKKLSNIMIIDPSKFHKNLINMIIYLNPSIPIEKVIEITKPVQYVQDNDFNPPLLILCFQHSKDFLKLGVDVI